GNGSLGEFVNVLYLNRPDGMKFVEAAKKIGWAESTYAKKRKQVFQTLTDAIQQDARERLQRASTWGTLGRATRSQFVGRDQTLRLALNAIAERKTVGIQGVGGIGKTSLGHVVAQYYGQQAPQRRPVFWHTFRAGLNDTLQSLMFGLGMFLHELGEPSIWLHFCHAHRRQFAPERPDYVEMSAMLALEMLQMALARLSENEIEPLFVLDEVDILQANHPMHAILLALIDGLCGEPQMAHHSLRMVLIGQQVLSRHAVSLPLKGLVPTDLAEWLRQLDIQASEGEIGQLWQLTQGHPLMLSLFINNLDRHQALLPQLVALSESPSLAMMWERIRRHLSEDALAAMQLLAVCHAPVPISNQYFPETVCQTLLLKDLVTISLDGRALLLNPTLRQMLYRRIAEADRSTMHLKAALFYEDMGEYTAAAYQFIEAGRPEMAAHGLIAHKKIEMANGQANTMLALLQRIPQTALGHETDQQALALLRSELLLYSGEPQQALQSIGTSRYAPSSLANGYAQRLQADTLAMLGRVDEALDQYRKGFDSLFELAGTQMMQISLRRGANYWHRLHDLTRAEVETRRARCQLEILEGNIRAYAGNNAPAITHYRTAIAYAEELGDEALQAAAHQELAHISATNLDTQNAIGHYEACDMLFANTGQSFCQWVTKGNMAYAYLCGQQYPAALPLAEEAYAYMKTQNHHGYGVFFYAFSAATLAETHYYLNNIEQAERVANEALGLEDEFYSPMAQYVLAYILRDRQQFDLALDYCQQAIATLKDIQHADAWRVLARAYDALGEVQRSAGYAFESKRAFTHALNVYQQLGSKKECARIQHKINQFYALPMLGGGG
ncbi:MAG: hypothetical protein KIH69_019495, partial [Anaerolineae bacterium]|nr:hypothetical protein [Anaerolineae bacterium]